VPFFLDITQSFSFEAGKFSYHGIDQEMLAPKFMMAEQR